MYCVLHNCLEQLPDELNKLQLIVISYDVILLEKDIITKGMKKN